MVSGGLHSSISDFCVCVIFVCSAHTKNYSDCYDPLKFQITSHQTYYICRAYSEFMQDMMLQTRSTDTRFHLMPTVLKHRRHTDFAGLAGSPFSGHWMSTEHQQQTTCLRSWEQNWRALISLQIVYIVPLVSHLALEFIAIIELIHFILQFSWHQSQICLLHSQYRRKSSPGSWLAALLASVSHLLALLKQVAILSSPPRAIFTHA